MPDYKNPDVSLGFLKETLNTHLASAIKVIIDPIVDDTWNTEGVVFCVNGAMLDNGKIILMASSSKEPWTAERLLEELDLAAIGFPDSATLYCMCKHEVKRVDEIYGHSTQVEKWAGIPVEIVLGLDW